MEWYERQKKNFEKNVNEKQAKEKEKQEDSVFVKIEKSFETYIEEEKMEPVKEIVQELQDESVHKLDTEKLKNAENYSVIDEHMELYGDINTAESLKIYGIVKGNVTCKKNLILNGDVEGNITCQNAYIENAYIQGDIICGQNLFVTGKSKVNGDISTVNLENKGYIKGEITASEHVRLSATSVIIGDITAARISVEQGAVIKGCIMTGKR